MARRSLAPLLTALACLGCASTAAAAPITLGQGRHPDVAVDESNTAHVVWDAVDTGQDDRLLYCQIPRGSSACTNSETLTPPLEAIGRSSHVFAPGGGRIVIATIRCCGPGEGTTVYQSTDGGQTFGQGRRVGNFERGVEAMLGPGETVSTASTTRFQNAPLAGQPASTTADLDAGFTVPTYSAIGLFNGTTPVFVHADGDDTTYHVANGGDLNSASGWSGPTALPGGGEVAMETNPRGVELIQEGGTGNKRFWGARMFDGTGWTAFNQITEAGSPIFADIGGTPFRGGSFHAVWVDNRTPNRMRWARSPNGFNWSESHVALTGDEPDNMFNLRIAGAQDGRAFAVWDQNDNSGSTKGILLPEKGSGPPIDSVRVAQYEWQFHVPFPCTPQGSSLKAAIKTLGVKTLPKNKSVNITQVRFTLDKTPVVDKKPGWQGSFSTANLAAGSSHSLRAFISYRPLTGGKTKVAVLRATGVICP